MPPKARVIVATYNQLPLLRLALRGYRRQTSADFALTIADDGSSDDTEAFVAAFAAEAGFAVDYVRQDDQGFRKNRILNEAVRQSKGEPLLIFTDGDCIPPAHFVARHIEAHAPLSFHVGGAIRLSQEASASLTEDGIDQGRYEALGTAADRADLRKRRRKSHWGVLLRRKNRPKVLGLNMAFDRTLFAGLNGFDERFESWGVGEDSDMRDRAMRHRPRCVVRNLYLENDVFHIWHPQHGSGARAKHAAYMQQARPVFCEQGLAG